MFKISVSININNYTVFIYVCVTGTFMYICLFYYWGEQIFKLVCVSTLWLGFWWENTLFSVLRCCLSVCSDFFFKLCFILWFY